MSERALRWLVGVAVGAAVLPVVVAAGRGIADGWMPVWDNGYPAIRGWDVFSKNPPLLGTRSTAADVTGAEHVTHHPGPMEFYLLAPWLRLFGPAAGTIVGVALVNVAAIGTVAWLAFRRGKHLTTVVVMAGMAALTWSMGSQQLFDPWPPHVTLLSFAVVLVAAWSVADRDLVALPVLALSASFVLQTHTGYVLLAPGLTATAVALLAWRFLAERPAATPVAAAAAPTGSPSVRRWAVIAVLVALVCWLPPLYEQLAHEGGNATFLAEAGGEGYGGETYSSTTASRLLAATIALPPWWLPPSMDSPAIGMNGDGPPLALTLPLLGLVVGALAAAAWRAHRRGDHTRTTGPVVAIVAMGLTIFSVGHAPAPYFALKATGYARFVWITAAFVTIQLVLAGLDALRRRERPVDRPAMVAFAGAAAIAGLLALPAADRAHTGSARISAGTRDLADVVVPSVDGHGTVLVDIGAAMSPSHWYGPGLLAELVAAGVPVVVREPELVAQLGEHRSYEPGEAQLHLFVVPGDAPPMWAPDAELLASVGGRTRAEEAELAALRDELRVALERSGGLPLEPPSVLGPLGDESAAVAEAVDVSDLWSDVEALGSDPDALLEPGEAAQLVALLDLLGLADEALDDGFPAGDLVRYYELLALPEDADVSAWLVELDQP